jgi:hypothetical protein
MRVSARFEALSSCVQTGALGAGVPKLELGNEWGGLLFHWNVFVRTFLMIRPLRESVFGPSRVPRRRRPVFFGYRWLAIKMLLIIAGIWWCAEIWGRRHEDLRVLRESKDVVERGVVIAFWLSALFVAVLLGTYGLATLVELLNMARDIVR